MPARISIFLLSVVFCFQPFAGFSQQPKLILPVGHTGRVSKVQFSPDGKKILTSSVEKRSWETPVDNTVKIWEASSGLLLSDLLLFKGSLDEMVVQVLDISPDGSKVASVSKFVEAENGYKQMNQAPEPKLIDTVKIWDALNNKILFTFYGSEVSRVLFSPDGSRLAFDDGDSFRIVNAINGQLVSMLKAPAHKAFDMYQQDLYQFNRHAPKGPTDIICFSEDNSRIAIITGEGYFYVYDAITGKVIRELKGLANIDAEKPAFFSPDKSRLITLSSLDMYGGGTPGRALDDSIHLTDISTGRIIRNFNSRINFLDIRPCISKDNQSILFHTEKNGVNVYNAVTGALRFTIKGHKEGITCFDFSPDAKKIVTASKDQFAKLWDATTGKLLVTIRERGEVKYAAFSPDGQKLVTMTDADSIKIWDAASGNVVADIGYQLYSLNPVFSPDSKLLVTTSDDDLLKVWAITKSSGAISLKGNTTDFRAVFDSADSHKIILTHGDTVKVWDMGSNYLIDQPKGSYPDYFQTDSISYNRYFSPDRKKCLLFFNRSPDNMFYKSIITEIAVCRSDTGEISEMLHSADTFQLAGILGGKMELKEKCQLSLLRDHTDLVWSASFSPDGKFIITSSRDNTVKIWDAVTYELLFTFFVINDHDFLVIDKDNHYDGTEAARKLLYFTCADEVITLDQLKDQLWVPNLAWRIIKGEKISGTKLSDLNICGLTPEVLLAEESPDQFIYKIIPRRGGLGDTRVFINNIEAARYGISDLKKKDNYYELVLRKSDFSNYFKPGENNSLVIKSFTKDIDGTAISSRGPGQVTILTGEPKPPPNLYAVMMGVSDYKGDNIDLKYAAKDAEDLSAVVTAASKKMLNNDGKSHVMIYNVNTGKNRDVFPGKNDIKNVFDSIGKYATANDILLIFFAGHGVMQGENKTFYFLTADASGTDDLAHTGISSDELSEWIKPKNIKAQKRILIFDACNSGQAINNMVRIGENEQGFMAARNDDNAEQVKAIDKLNEKSGLFILSASASSQSAYELGRYSQGILTYSLLKAIKEEPDILENDKYLNVGLWFNKTETIVGNLAKENNIPQTPQLVSTTNFNIGIVDDSVRKMITKGNEKPLFTSSIFQNEDVSIADDDLQLSKLINQQLKAEASSADQQISYVPDSNSPDSYSLRGRYTVSGSEIILNVNIRQAGLLKYQFRVTGKTTDKETLVKNMIRQVMNWLNKNK